MFPTRVSLDGRAAWLLGAPASFNPRFGYGVRLGARRLVWALGPVGIELGGELVHDRFARPEVVTQQTPAGPAIVTDAHELFETSGAAFATVSLVRWRLRPYLRLGAGLSWAFFHAPELATAHDVQLLLPLARIDVGLAYAFTPHFSLRLAGELTRYFSDATAAVPGAPGAPPQLQPIFGDIANVVLGADYSF